LESDLNKEKQHTTDLESDLNKEKQHTTDLESDLNKEKQRATDLETDLNKEKQRATDLETDLQQLTLQNNDYLKEIKDLHDEIESVRIRLKSFQNKPAQTNNANKKKQPPRQPAQQAQGFPAKVKKLERKVFDLRTSYSFRIGQTFVNAVAKPGINTIMLPFRFIGLVFEFIFVRKHT
jgi:chromosome segregation ATPase